MYQVPLSITAVLLAFGYGSFLLTRRPVRLGRSALALGLAACVALEVFDLLAITYPERLFVWRSGGLFCDGLLPFLWVLFSMTFYRARGLRGLSWFQRVFLALSPAFLLVALFAPLEEFYYSPDFAEEKILFLGKYGYLFYIGIMGYLTLAMVHLERTLAHLSRGERWRVKLEIVGVGALLGMYVVYYSQALLYRSLDMNLMPARSIALIFAVGLMAYSRLKRGEASRIVISRGMAYRSVVILSVGCYLLGLGLLGEGMRYFGASSQRSVFIVIATLPGVAILVLLLSETVRRKIKVWLHKNFYRSKFDYRQQWLEFTGKLSSARNSEELQAAILAFYCETFDVRGAGLYLRDHDLQRYLPTAFFEMDAIREVFDESTPFVRQLASRDWVLNLEDEVPEDFWGSLEFRRWGGISLVVPLRFDGRLEGFILLGPQVLGGEALTYEDFDLMKALARQATSSLLSLKLSARLSVAQEMAAIGKVSTFVLHDLKNQVSGLSLVVDNAREYIDDPEFQEDMLETLENTVANFKGLIHRLKNLKEKPSLNLQSCDLMDIAVETAGGIGGEVVLSGSTVKAVADGEEIRKVLLNLVLNAVEAGGGKEPVGVEVGAAEMAFFRVADSGCGMSEDFIRKRLFRPFETTKKKGFGIGLYQCRLVVEAHGGRIAVESRVGEGTTFTVWLPRAEKGDFTAEGAEDAEKGLEEIAI